MKVYTLLKFYHSACTNFLGLIKKLPLNVSEVVAIIDNDM